MLGLLAGLVGLYLVEQSIYQVIFLLYLQVSGLGYIGKGLLLVFLVE